MIRIDPSELGVLYAFIALVIVILIVIYIINVFVPFLEQRTYMKMEIKRSSRKEQRVWKARLRRLYVSMIPIIGPFIAKRMHTHSKKK